MCAQIAHTLSSYRSSSSTSRSLLNINPFSNRSHSRCLRLCLHPPLHLSRHLPITLRLDSFRRSSFPLTTTLVNALRTVTSMRLLLPVPRLYAALTLFLSALQLRHAISAAHPHATARVAVQLLTALALLPACHVPTSVTPAARRWPVLSAFLLTFSLIIDAVLRVLTALEVLSYPLNHVIFHSRLTLVLTRLALSLAAAFLFRSHASLAHSPRQPHQKRKSSFENAQSPAMVALYLHAVTSALSHLRDIVSLFSSSTSLCAALDLLSSIVTATWVIPLLHYTSAVLMQATPAPFANTINLCRKEVLALEGVLFCSNMHVWEESTDVVVGTLCVEVDGRVSKSWVLEKAAAAFEGVVDDLTVQVESWRGDQADLDKRCT